MFKSKLYLLITILGMLALVAGACAQPALPETPEGDGTIIIYVTDAPPEGEVKSIMVTLSEVQVHKAPAEQEQEKSQNEEGEWIKIDIGDDATFDLLQIKGVEQLIGTSKVEADKYTQVRLVVGRIQIKIGTGDLIDATLPGEELRIIQSFDVIAGETTALILDFDADEMIALTRADEMPALTRADEMPALAEAGGITVKPVVKLIVRQEKSDI